MAPYPPSKKLHISGSFNTNGNQTLVGAPPAGYEIVVAHWSIQNSTGTSTIAKLLAGSFPFFVQVFPTTGFQSSTVYPQGLEERCGSGNALILNLSGANAHYVTLGYWIEPVKN